MIGIFRITIRKMNSQTIAAPVYSTRQCANRQSRALPFSNMARTATTTSVAAAGAPQ
jgi:hypothetical protein